MAALLLLLFNIVCGVVQFDGVAGNSLQADTTNYRRVGAEVGLQQTFRQSYGLENLRATVRAYRRDSHLGHNLEQTLLQGVDIVGLGGSVVFLNLTPLDEVVEDGVGHVGAQCRCTIA